MFKKLAFIALFLLNTQTSNAIIMTRTGLDTGSGFIEWAQLGELPEQTKKLCSAVAALSTQTKQLRNTLIIGGVVTIAAFAYTHWMLQKTRCRCKDSNYDTAKIANVVSVAHSK